MSEVPLYVIDRLEGLRRVPPAHAIGANFSPKQSKSPYIHPNAVTRLHHITATFTPRPETQIVKPETRKVQPGGWWVTPLS